METHEQDAATDPGRHTPLRDPLPQAAEGPAPVRWGQLGFVAGVVGSVATLTAGAVLLWARLDARVEALEHQQATTAEECTQAREWARDCRVNTRLIADKLGVMPLDPSP